MIKGWTHGQLCKKEDIFLASGNSSKAQIIIYGSNILLSVTVGAHWLCKWSVGDVRNDGKSVI